MIASPSEELSSLAIRQLLDKMRRQPLALLAGCGCASPIASVSLRDFEEAVVFHIQTRWRLMTNGEDKKSDLGTLIDAIDRLPEADRRHRILRDLHNSLRSYVQQCSAHLFRAELTG